jgi:hypothetical protein
MPMTMCLNQWMMRISRELVVAGAARLDRHFLNCIAAKTTMPYESQVFRRACPQWRGLRERKGASHRCQYLKHLRNTGG